MSAGAEHPMTLVEADAAGREIEDGMAIRLRAAPRLRRGDTLAVYAPDGERLDILMGAERPDGSVTVWYAIHPTLRHWLGRLEQVAGREWRLRMEPFHLDMQAEFRATGPAVVDDDWA